jgi:benzoyl-CoA reductase/2-hydroxyglutaryl-CoA dehydratase subunit BcrC/BadD/HgdB
MLNKNNRDDIVMLEDKNNPISKAVNRMKITKNFAKLEGIRDFLDLNFNNFIEYYKSNKRVCCTFPVPREIFYMLGIDVISPHQISVLISDSSTYPMIVGKARSIVQYSTYCSFTKTELGIFESGYFPLPEVLIAPSFFCGGKVNLYSYIGKKYNIPVFYIDCPYDTNEKAKTYLAEQLRKITMELAAFFKIELKKKYIDEIFYYSNEATKWWLKYLETLDSSVRTFSPAKLETIMSSTVLMAKFGLPQSVEITKKCYNELKQLVELKKEDENCPKKILWCGDMPFHSSDLVRLWRSMDVQIIFAMPYETFGIEKLNPAEPWESLAHKMMQSIGYGSIDHRVKKIDSLIYKYNIDGVIELCQPWCKPVAGQSFMIKEYLKKKEIPYLAVEGDLIDTNNFSIGQVKTRIEAFVEMLKK